MSAVIVDDDEVVSVFVVLSLSLPALLGEKTWRLCLLALVMFGCGVVVSLSAFYGETTLYVVETLKLDLVFLCFDVGILFVFFFRCF